MPYSAEISRINPAFFVFLVDQSTSMGLPFAGQPGKSRAEGVADALNRLLQNLVLKCARADGVRDYFFVSVVGYGVRVGQALGPPLDREEMVPVSLLANHPLRVEQRTRKVDDGAGGFIDQPFKFPVWVEPKANGKTPMNEAVGLATRLVSTFLMGHPHSYPPIVINITDGKPTDANPERAARDLRELASSDGNILLFNAHLSENPAYPVIFPDRPDSLPDDFARLLFRMSSPLPPSLLQAAGQEGFTVTQGARGFVFNADLVSVVRFLDLGTRTRAVR